MLPQRFSTIPHGTTFYYNNKLVTTVITDPTKNKKGKYATAVPEHFTVKNLRSRYICVRQVKWRRKLTVYLSESDSSDSDSEE